MHGEFVEPRSSKAVRPAIVLAVAVAVAMVLLLLPASWTAPLKGGAAAALRPGQRAALFLRREVGQAVRRLRDQVDTATKLAAARRRIERLEAENRRLAVAAVAPNAISADDAPAGPEPHEPLLLVETIPARVLGRQARAYLARHDLLDAGSTEGVQPDALVLEEAPPLVDRGGDASLEPGRLVLTGRGVWGKIVDVGPYTSTVRRVTEPGYRDVVRLAAVPERGRTPRFTAEGILEGTGEPLARVRLVSVEEPVAVGDLVCAAAADGVVDQPLVYGRVVRCQRRVGAAHWEIWVEPTAARSDPLQVRILRIELNPKRVAGRVDSARR